MPTPTENDSIRIKGEKRSPELESPVNKKAKITNGKTISPKTHSTNLIFRKFVNNALTEKAAGNAINFNVLRKKFTTHPSEESAPSSHELQMTLSALTQNVSRLNGSCSTLVLAIIKCQWVARSGLFVGAYVRFLGNLVSAHPNYMGIVTEMLVGYFGFLPNHTTRLPGHQPVSRSVIDDRIHYALQFILDLVPTAAFSTLFPALVAEFPHKSEKKQAHKNYMRNLLRVVEYAPALRNKLLAMLTDRVIKVDVEIQVDLDELEEDEGEALEAELTGNMLENIKDNTVIEKDDDTDGGDGGEEYDEDSDSDAVQNIKETVDKLDAMLEILFDHYSKSFPGKYTEDPSMDSINTFELLLRSFDTTVLPTYRSRYTQFLLFWASQRSPRFSDQFCVSILEKAFDNSRPQVTRQAAAAYIASFVARAKFMPQKDVRAVVRLICRWLGAFVDERSLECRGPDVSRWGGFYSVCQAVMYIFCFRWRDLKEEEEDEFGIVEGRWTSGLEVLAKVITSRFNPLKVCSPAVVENFAKIASHLQFLFCFTILDQNKRTGLVGDGELESYFPFDPYGLKKSKKWIEDCYIEWQPVEGLDDDEDSSDDVDNDSDEPGSINDDTDNSG
ncbi:DNA independent RNA polymerase I transcription factor [Maublancomyces gigas]|uniref:DNA independent RNA polymerase I transcription factor n=1 Tax=Discina gigas TaxID=1032678 RepID=A0ABR3GMQ3_9PEZI